jgi:endonuclease/exonuclease/phosphatase family metal-dependent hydrolase
LSKHPAVNMKKMNLPYTEENEPRVTLEIISVLPGNDTIAFICTHLDHHVDSGDRINQISKITEVFSKCPYPAILAGDLNDIPGSTAINLIEKYWINSSRFSEQSSTYPSDNPTKKIDFILVDPKSKWKITDSKTICDKIASDHCALLITVELIK